MDLNILLILGTALFAGTAGGWLFSKMKIPAIICYIFIGFLFGKSGLGLMDESILEVLSLFNYFALGLIGFIVGGELKREVLKKYGKSLLYTVFCGGAGAFLAVFAFTAAAGVFFLDDLKLSFALALLLGAIASVADPASQTNIIRESKSRGPLTSNMLGMVALSDALAILLFAIASSLAAGLIGSSGARHPLLFFYETGGAVIFGGLGGWLFSKVLDRYPPGEKLPGFFFGFILLVTGMSVAAGLDMILSVMALGFALVNLRPEGSRRVFRLAGSAIHPIFVLFFIIMGAALDLGHFAFIPFVILLCYLAGVLAGKFWGIRLGALVVRAPSSVVKHLPRSLFAQGGIAVGLTVLAVQNFHGEIETILLAVIAPAVLILQIAGPLLARNAIHSAGEAGLDITENDILEDVRFRDLPERAGAIIYEDTTIPEVLKLFSTGDDLYYPVVSREKKLLGIISVEGIKSTLMEEDLAELLLAADIMEPVPASAGEESSLAEIKEIMEKNQVEFVPVVGGDNRLRGFVEKRMLRSFISSRLLDMKERLNSIEDESGKQQFEG